MATLDKTLDHLGDPDSATAKLAHLTQGGAFGRSRKAATAATGTYADAHFGHGREWPHVILWASTREHGLPIPIYRIASTRTYDQAEAEATRINEHIARTAEEHETTFIGFGHVNPQTNTLTMDDAGPDTP